MLRCRKLCRQKTWDVKKYLKFIDVTEPYREELYHCYCFPHLYSQVYWEVCLGFWTRWTQEVVENFGMGCRTWIINTAIEKQHKLPGNDPNPHKLIVYITFNAVYLNTGVKTNLPSFSSPARNPRFDLLYNHRGGCGSEEERWHWLFDSLHEFACSSWKAPEWMLMCLSAPWPWILH